ncbi:hypothetical protein E5355_04965 [Bacteroides muris (ex Afrizal et al. 2022)]|uniref:Uncharacterized protein n=1 Tax=Bacteroides muris (ex Afrizal et al. 2022) TaxID=2516960 RepID=A0A4S2B1T4_9BACE|nr:hypothetical protein E5355_04965 [Bacteroides muris (ex Afrizal et al. 2022)]
MGRRTKIVLQNTNKGNFKTGCQNTKNMKITPATDICSKGDFVKKRVLTHPPIKKDVPKVHPYFLYH